MTPENRILLEKIFSEISYKDHDNIVAENTALQEDNAKLENEIRELKAQNEYEKSNHILGKFEKDYQDLQKDNTELKAENERLIAVIERVEKDYEDSQIEAGSLKADRDWERANPKLGKVVTELKEQVKVLQEEREKLNITIKELKADSEHWYEAFNKSQGMCLDFITQNRTLGEQLHGVGKVTAV